MLDNVQFRKKILLYWKLRYDEDEGKKIKRNAQRFSDKVVFKPKRDLEYKLRSDRLRGQKVEPSRVSWSIFTSHSFKNMALKSSLLFPFPS